MQQRHKRAHLLYIKTSDGCGLNKMLKCLFDKNANVISAGCSMLFQLVVACFIQLVVVCFMEMKTTCMV